jgi:hypothetical protein
VLAVARFDRSDAVATRQRRVVNPRSRLLEAATARKRPGIHSREAQLFDQTCNHALRVVVVSCDKQSKALVSATNAFRDSGPRELPINTSCPCCAKSRAAVPPIMPLPMIPIFTLASSREQRSAVQVSVFVHARGVKHRCWMA